MSSDNELDWSESESSNPVLNEPDTDFEPVEEEKPEPEEKPKKRSGKLKGVNLAAGDWSASGWETVDLNGDPDHRVNLKKERTPYKSGEAPLVFCSHFLEHCTDEEALAVLKEAHRILEKGGICRISVPSLIAAFQAYAANDQSYFQSGEILLKGDNLETMLCNVFASYSRAEGGGGPHIDSIQFAKLYQKRTPQEIAAEAIKLLDHRREVEHQNWFDARKLIQMMEDAGFKAVVKSEYKGSSRKEFNDCDNRPITSIFVEGIK